MICSDSGCRIRLCADGTVNQSLSGHLSCGAVGWNIRARPRLDSTRLLPVHPSPLPLCSSSPPLLSSFSALLSYLIFASTAHRNSTSTRVGKSKKDPTREEEHEMQTQTTTPSYAGSAYRPQQHQQQRYYPQQYTTTTNNYNTNNTYTNPAYQPLSPSTFYPTSPTSATVYSRATTPGAGAGRSTYSGYVNTFGTQKPAHTRLPMKRVRFQRARPSLSFASADPNPNTPAMAVPPGRVHTASTARSRSRRPVYAYAPHQQQQQQQTQRPQQQQYPFHMPAYGPPQPFAVPSSVANTNTNASTRRRTHHVHTTAPSVTVPAAAVVPASTPRIPTTRTTRLARRPSKANMGYTRLGPSHGRRTASGSSSSSSGARSLSLCALVGRLADALLGNGPHTAARRAASAAAKLSGGSGSRMGSGSGHKRNARRDAVWRAQLEDVVCRECARLLEYAQ